MKTKTVLVWLVAGVIIVLLGVNIVLMLGRMRMPMPNNQQNERAISPIEKRFHEQLNLNDVQKDNFRAIRQSFRHEAKVIHDSMYSLNMHFIDAIDKNPIDSAEVDKILNGICIQHSKMKMQMARMYWKLKSECNPEQQVALKNHFKEFMPGELGPRADKRCRKNKQTVNNK